MEQQPDNIDQELTLLKEHIAKTFRPSPSFADAQHRVTTATFKKSLHDHLTFQFSAAELIAVLVDLDFQSETVGLKTFWLIDNK